MKYGIIGTGGVAHAIATKLIELGHEVMMGARSATNEKAVSRTKSNGERAFNGTFADRPDSEKEYSTACRAFTRSKPCTLPEKKI